MHISFAVLDECNMKQMRIATNHASIYRNKVEYNNTDTNCMLLLLFLLSKLFIPCSSAYKRWLCDNQPLIVKLPKQYKNKDGGNVSTKVFTQTIVMVP